MVRRGRLVAIEGGSASGKTTLVRAAAHTLGWRPLPEAFDRLDPAPSLDLGSPRELLRIEATLLAEETRRYQEARRLCERGTTVIADTGFFGPLTYTQGLVDLRRTPVALVRSLERAVRGLVRSGRLGIPDLAVDLRTTSDERARRARSAARRHPPALFSRHEAVGALERRYLAQAFKTAAPDRFRTLRADVAPPLLVQRLRALVEKADPTPASRSEGLAVIAQLHRARRPGLRSNAGPNR